MKTSIAFPGIIVRMVTVILIGLLATQVLTAQGWYDSDWTYRNEVTVSHPLGVTGATLTGYQVKISLTGGVGGNFDFTKAVSGGSDIRFTAADGITLIPFWIENWIDNTSATIWIKVPTIPGAGTSVYLYYGNSAPTEPLLNQVEVPPTGPFTRAAGNPIIPAGATGTSLLAENIVFDPVTGHYWMCLANYTQRTISLCWSDTPADPTSWTWGGNAVTTFTEYVSGAPHLQYYDGLWYLFYADRPNIMVATATRVDGTFTIQPTPVLQPLALSGTWDSYRVDEPYVFQRRDGKWILVYMGDAGGITEQVGYATADNITGPYTPFANNPCIPFGPSGSFDAGTVADPWVYEYHGVYYIGYTVSPTKNSPWYTACATTLDWQTFTKIGVILPLGSGADGSNSFRGALTRIGDEYVFSYTNDGYRMAIATQPVYMTLPDIINERGAVFDFYDGFDGSALDWSKWSLMNGQATQATVSGGNLNLNSPTAAGYIRINGTASYGMNYLTEARGYHPDQGTTNLIAEVGMATTLSYAVRIVDDFQLGTEFWQKQAINGGSDTWQNMAQPADQNWHVFKVWRTNVTGSNVAGFQIDETPAEGTTLPVPTIPLQPFLMSYGAGNDFVVDWIRVRQYVGADPSITVGSEEAINRWTGDGGTSWSTVTSWSAGYVPTVTDNVAIPDVTNDPVISGGTFECNSLVIDPGAALTVEASGVLDVTGLITINSSGIASTGSLINRGTVGGDVRFNRFLRPEATMGSLHFVSSPVGGMTISSFFSENLNLGELWEYNEPENSWDLAASGNLLSGKGYNITQTTGSLGEYSFTGSVVSAATFIATAPYLSTHLARTNAFDYGLLNPNPIWADGRSWDDYGGGGWNLMGNPFTSAMSASAFITANSGLFDPHYQALYVYDGVNGVYRYAAASVPGYPEAGDFGNFVQAGQGFFVLALYDGATFTFNSTMQVHQPAVSILKSTETSDNPWPGLLLKLKYGEKERETTIVFNDAMTTGSDPGYDVGQMSTSPDFELYTVLAAGDNSVNFARQALPLSNAERYTVPVGIDTKNGGEVAFSAFTIPMEGIRFWLEDRVTGTFTDLTTKSYTVTLPAKTYGTGRFYIISSANTPTSVSHPGADDPALRVWISDGNLIIKGELGDKALYELYDLNGKTIMDGHLEGNELNIINLQGKLHGVYVVRVVDGLKITTRKVAVL
ncbi:MAG: DUF2341 domain-containing protein [Bacteroidales bacterium]